MEKPSTMPAVRTMVRLSSEQRKVMNDYFIRTAVLWNFLHRHLKDQAEVYMASSLPDADQQFETAVFDLCEKINNANYTPQELTDDPAWQKYVDQIRELPSNLVVNRGEDFFSAYRVTKETLNTANPVGLPNRKTTSSSQSVRFSPSDFVLSNGRLSIDSAYPLAIDVPDFSNLSLTVPYSLSITRKKINEADSRRYGPPDEDLQNYVVSLKAI